MSDTSDNTPNESEDRPLQNSGDNVRASWPFSLHDVRINMANCAAEAKDVMISAFLWCIDPKHPITRQEFAKAIGYDASTVWKIYAGKYIHHESKARLDVPVKMVQKTRTWMELEKDRFEGGKTEFVVTPTAQRIFTAADLARESQTPVYVVGVSHIGKTWALEYYTSKNNHGHTVYVRMQAASGVGGMVRCINEAIGNSGRCNTAAAIERIKKALTPNTLLILDELHLLAYTYRTQSFFACLEVIREIYDETHCGLLLCGTKLMLDRMSAGQHGEMEQLLRRGVHRVVLPGMPSKRDIELILQHSGLEFPAKDYEVSITVRDQKGKDLTIKDRPYAILRQLAKTAGLKAITERLRYGRKLALKAHQKITWTNFVDAHLRIEKQADETPDWD